MPTIWMIAGKPVWRVSFSDKNNNFTMYVRAATQEGAIKTAKENNYRKLRKPHIRAWQVDLEEIRIRV